MSFEELEGKKTELEEIALERMAKFNLIEEGWCFEWSNKRSSLGDCNYSKKRIRLSEYFAAHMNFDDMVDTINHEIAHAIVGKGHGHDDVWKAACLKTGATPSRKNNKKPEREIKFKWIGQCPSCGYKVGRHRLTERIKDGSSCPKCSNIYDPQFKLNWNEEV